MIAAPATVAPTHRSAESPAATPQPAPPRLVATWITTIEGGRARPRLVWASTTPAHGAAAG